MKEEITTDSGIVSIRIIRAEDDVEMGRIIRSCFIDYNAKQEGTVYSDTVVDHLFDAFQHERSRYFILEKEGIMLGGAGISALKDADPGVCELQKMYIRKEGRGKGLGRLLLGYCLSFARTQGYHTCYLESLPELKDALRMYEKAGFSYIPERMGNTGYYGCSLYMKLEL